MENTLDGNRGLNLRWLASLGWSLLGIIAAVAAGAFIGWLESQFEKLLYIYLVFLCVAFWFLVGFFLTRTRFRSRVLTLLLSLLILMGFLGGYEINSYLNYRQIVKQEILTALAETDPEITSADLEPVLDNIIYEITGLPPVLHYLQLRVENTPIDFFLRTIIGLGLAIVAWRGYSIKPYCKECRDFYKGGVNMGGLPQEEYDRFKALVESGSLYDAGQMLRKTVSVYPKALVYIQSCNSPRLHDSFLTADRFFTQPGSSKVLTQNLLRVKISGLQYANFNTGASTPRPVPASQAEDLEQRTGS